MEDQKKTDAGVFVYCVKCHAKVQLNDYSYAPKAFTNARTKKEGTRHSVQGKCPKCGSNACSFVKKPAEEPKQVDPNAQKP